MSSRETKPLTVVLAAAALWALACSLGRDAHPATYLQGLVLFAAAYTAGLAVARRGTAAVATATLVASAAVLGALLLVTDATSGHALAPPLSYGNADGALAAQGATAAALGAVVTRGQRRRAMLGLCAALVVGTFFTESRTASIGAVAVPAVTVVALRVPERLPSRLVVVGAGAGCVMAFAAGTVVLGAAHSTAPARATADGLSQRRLDLWHDGLELTLHNPVRGVGPGMFTTRSPVAHADADVHAEHSVWLRVAAEQGVPGLLLLDALGGLVFAGLLRSRAGGSEGTTAAITAVGTAGFAAFAVQASLDYTVQFPAVLALATLNVALASGAMPERREGPAALHRAVSPRLPEDPRRTPDVGGGTAGPR